MAGKVEENELKKIEPELSEGLEDLRKNAGNGKRAPRIIRSLFAPREYSVLRAKAIVRGLIVLLAAVLLGELFFVSRTILPDISFGEDGPAIMTYAVPEINDLQPSSGEGQNASMAITQTVNRDNLFAEQQTVPAYEPPPEPAFIDEVEFPALD